MANGWIEVDKKSQNGPRVLKKVIFKFEKKFCKRLSAQIDKELVTCFIESTLVKKNNFSNLRFKKLKMKCNMY
jgi:hypothetical protein